MPLTDEQREQFAALLAEAEPGDLPGYVPKQTFKGRLSEKDKKVQALEADYQARLSQLQQEHAEAQAKLAEYDNAGKTAAELAAAELAKKDTELEAWQRKHSEAQSLAEQRYEAMKQGFLRDAVLDLISKSGIAPAYAPAALREALAENQFSVADNDGQFSLQMTKDGLPVDDVNAEFTGGWYQKRTDLHAKTGTEMPSPGAGRPPGPPPPKDPLEGMTPDQQMAYAIRKTTSTRY